MSWPHVISTANASLGPTVARMRPRVLRHSSDSILKRPDDTHSASVCSAARALHWHIIRQKRLVPAYRKKVTLAHTQQKLTSHLALRLVLAVRPPLWHASLLSALPCASPLPQASWSGICWQRQACLYVCCTLMIPAHVPRPACQSRCDGAGGQIPTTQRRNGIHLPCSTLRPFHRNGVPAICRVTSVCSR